MLHEYTLKMIIQLYNLVDLKHHVHMSTKNLIITRLTKKSNFYFMEVFPNSHC